jgi:hypothetical protein
MVGASRQVVGRVGQSARRSSHGRSVRPALARPCPGAGHARDRVACAAAVAFSGLAVALGAAARYACKIVAPTRRRRRNR